jgi:hypothetical protein
MVTAPEKSENTKENGDKNQFYRLFVIGKNHYQRSERVRPEPLSGIGLE